MLVDFRDAFRSIVKQPAGSLFAILGCSIAAATVLPSCFAAVFLELPPAESPEAAVSLAASPPLGEPVGQVDRDLNLLHQLAEEIREPFLADVRVSVQTVKAGTPA